MTSVHDHDHHHTRWSGSDSDSWGKRLCWFPLVVSPWCKKRTLTWKPGNMRTWLHLTFQSGERCQGWCRIDSTPKSVGTLLYVPCARQLLDSWILIRNIEYWVATSHLINNGISVKDIVKAGGPVARILRMASTTWWNGDKETKSQVQTFKRVWNCESFSTEIQYYMNCSNEFLRSHHPLAERTP